MGKEDAVEVTERAYRSVTDGPVSDTEAFASQGVPEAELEAPTLDREGRRERDQAVTGDWPVLEINRAAAQRYPQRVPTADRGPLLQWLATAAVAVFVMALVVAAGGALWARMADRAEEPEPEPVPEAPPSRLPVRDGLR